MPNIMGFVKIPLIASQREREAFISTTCFYKFTHGFKDNPVA
jgi:hypothetical protein